ncbi:hypothetical protein HYW82_00155 [Candidatus Peregrinibacteria bacterium]|nr:hypothetical protein [Candidatus Peregrinibacteria bacterium]
MFAYLPPATEEVVNDTCKATTGSKKFLTLEGYANAFPGFSQYLRSVSENNLRSKLREGIISFVRFEGIMNNRFKKGDDSYQRMKRATLNSPTIVTDTPPQAFIDELQAAIGKVITAYNDTELNDAWKLINTETGNIAERAEREKQDNINYAFERFSKIFTKVVKQDNGEKMTGIIAAANFEGMPFGQNEAEKAKRKAQYADLFSLD